MAVRTTTRPGGVPREDSPKDYFLKCLLGHGIKIDPIAFNNPRSPVACVALKYRTEDELPQMYDKELLSIMYDGSLDEVRERVMTGGVAATLSASSASSSEPVTLSRQQRSTLSVLAGAGDRNSTTGSSSSSSSNAITSARVSASAGSTTTANVAKNDGQRGGTCTDDDAGRATPSTTTIRDEDEPPAVYPVPQPSSSRVANAQNANGETVLMKVCRRTLSQSPKSNRAGLQVVSLLLKSGANPMVCCDSGKNVLHDVFWTAKPPPQEVLSAMEQMVDMVRESTGKNGILELMLSEDKHGYTPLDYVVPSQQPNWRHIVDTVVAWATDEARGEATSMATDEEDDEDDDDDVEERVPTTDFSLSATTATVASRRRRRPVSGPAAVVLSGDRGTMGEEDETDAPPPGGLNDDNNALPRFTTTQKGVNDDDDARGVFIPSASSLGVVSSGETTAHQPIAVAPSPPSAVANDATTSSSLSSSRCVLELETLDRGLVRAVVEDTHPDDKQLLARLCTASASYLISDVSDPDAAIVAVSPAFVRETGYDAADVLGRNCRFLQGPGTSTAQVDLVRRALATTATVRVSLLNYRKNGDTFLNNFLLTPLRRANGVCAFYIGVQNCPAHVVADRRRRLDAAGFLWLDDTDAVVMTQQQQPDAALSVFVPENDARRRPPDDPLFEPAAKEGLTTTTTNSSAVATMHSEERVETPPVKRKARSAPEESRVQQHGGDDEAARAVTTTQPSDARASDDSGGPRHALKTGASNRVDAHAAGPQVKKTRVVEAGTASTSSERDRGLAERLTSACVIA